MRLVATGLSLGQDLGQGQREGRCLGRIFDHIITPGYAVKTEPFYVAVITSVLHSCMGGLEVDTDSAGAAGRAGCAGHGPPPVGFASPLFQQNVG